MVVKLVISVSSAVKEVEVSLQGQILGFMMWKTTAFNIAMILTSVASLSPSPVVLVI